MVIIASTMQSIRDYLTLVEMTQTELAKRAGLRATDLCNYMSGKREPKIRALRKLSEATGITLDRLVKDFPE